MCVGPLPTRMTVPISLHCEQLPQAHKPTLPQVFASSPPSGQETEFSR